MKKIVFMVINMNIGGTEKALLNMIDEISREEYNITILMLENRGGFLEDIPKDVHVKYLKNYEDIKDVLNKPPKEVALNLINNNHILKAARLFITSLICKLKNDRSLYFKYVLRNYPVIEEEYDIAVAYAGPMEFITYYVLNNIKAREKYQWIHFDVRKIGFNKKFYNKKLNEFNNTVVVSEEGRQALVDMFPKIKDKIKVRLNTVPKKNILKKSKAHKGFNDGFDGIRIVTVGRLSEEKGQDIAINVCKRLILDGLNIKWYCIGNGVLYNEYKKLINTLNIEDSFKLLGTKKNPYPFMKECDIYVQPSRHEGFCITLGEANIFNKTIVANNFVGAKEQIGSKENCYITNNEDEMYRCIKDILIKNKFYRGEKNKENIIYGK